MRSMFFFAAFAAAALLGHEATADVVFENAHLRSVIGDDAVWKSVIDLKTGTERCAVAKRIGFATVRVNGKTYNANAAERTGDQLVIGFSDCDSELVYTVVNADEWIAFQLVQVRGTRPTHVTLLRLGVSITERKGTRLNAAWNDDCVVCVRATGLETHGSCSRSGDYTLLQASTQDAPGPPLEGAGAAILVAQPAELKPMLSRFSAAFDLPRNESEGVASKDLPLARQSYWFLSFPEKDVDQVIDYCRKTGIRQVMLNSGAWCRSVGHFTFKESAYPDGIESLRRMIAKLHEAGILVGMHTFASKISKHDAFVTPVPSPGFCVDMTAMLAQDVGSSDTAITTASDLSQWPGSPACKRKVWEGHVSKHQEVIINDEIVRFETIGPEGKWDTFLGCQRGAWGTRPAVHKAGAECLHYAVDGCINGYILDQDAPLFQETTSRLAHVFDYCDFDMIYFDGSEDVDRRRYHYYSSNAHAVPMRKFKKRPVIHMGGGFTHGLWHSFTRSGTIDQYPGTYLGYLHAGGTIDEWPTCKDHIDVSVKRLILCEDDMTPAELGWFGIGPKRGDYDGLQFDEIEYLMCKSLAYNAPISLQTSFSRMEAHRLTPDILGIVRHYEETRRQGTVTSGWRAQLKQMGRDFIMLPAEGPEDGPPKFVEATVLDEVAGTHDVRSLVGQLGEDTYATLWHFTGKDGTLTLNVDRRQVSLRDVRGRDVEHLQVGGRAVIPVDHRRLLLFFPRRSVDDVRSVLSQAVLELRKPTILWLPASDYRDRTGDMVAGSAAGITDDQAMGDFVLCSGHIDRTGRTPCYCEYRIQIPRKARWTLWARVRYPHGGDMSFGLVLPDDEVTLTGRQVIGNCGVNDKQWHWTGRGSGVTTVPPGAPVTFDLEPGELVFRIYPREGSGSAATNPRLDCFCISEDPGYIPTDQDAARAFAVK